MDIFSAMGMSPLDAFSLTRLLGVTFMLGAILFFAAGVSLTLNLDTRFFWTGFAFIILAALCFAGYIYVIDVQADLIEQRPHIDTPAHSFNTSTTQPIASLGDSNYYSTDGKSSFILGSGSTIVEGRTVEYYTYYKRLENDEYEWDKIEKAGVIIKEDAETNPHIEWIYHHEVAVSRFYTDNGDYVGGGDTITTAKIYIHCPKGTIIKDYELKI